MKSDARSLRLLPSPIPDAIDLDAAINELETLSEHLSRRRQELPAAVQGKGSCRSRSHQRASFSRDWPALPSKLEWPDRDPPGHRLDCQTVSLGSWRWQIAKVDAIRRKDDYDGAQLDQGNDFGARSFANQSSEHQTTNLRVGRSNRSGRANQIKHLDRK